MNLLVWTLVLASAGAPVQEIGPIGPPVVVHPHTSPLNPFDNNSMIPNHAITYAETPDRYFSVFSVKGAARDLHGAFVDPATGLAGASIPLDTSADTISMPAVSWNPMNGRYLAVFLRSSVGTVTATSLRPSV